jgi:hypothetical protein
MSRFSRRTLLAVSAAAGIAVAAQATAFGDPDEPRHGTINAGSRAALGVLPPAREAPPQRLEQA